jgi:hypothetical protein
MIIVTFFCSKAIEEGDRSYRHLRFLFCNTTTEEGDGNNYHRLLLLYNTTIEENVKQGIN